MNKKNLSVVMAGAMLATSVAPVLADTTSTNVDLGNVALLKKIIVDKMAEGQVSTNVALTQKLNNGSSSQSAIADSDIISSDVATMMVEGQSKYGIRVVDKDGKPVSTKSTIVYNYKNIDTYITGLKAGETIEIYERKTSDFHGEILPGTLPSVKETAEKYSTLSTVTDEMKAYLGINVWDSSAAYKSKIVDASGADISITDGKLVIKTKKLNSQDVNDRKTITLTADDQKVDGRLAVDANGKLIDATKEEDIQKFDHFLVGAKAWNPSQKIDDQTVENLTKVASYTMTGEATNSETLSVADITDGIALTAKGSELLTDLNNAAKKVEQENAGNSANSAGALVQITQDNTFNSYGLYKLDIKYYSNKKDALAKENAVKTVSITSTKSSEITSLKAIFEGGDLKVGTVGGANRYETAVNVAKAMDITALDPSNASNAKTNNIVIVNGSSLVDGLAAAPFAASINAIDNNTNTKKLVAPVLLSETDKLPTATKEYIAELVTNIKPSERNTVNINLIGGEAVLSESLEKELKDMGFNVRRFGGDNREETSVEVAKKIVTEADGGNGAFIVGSTGEADAMSIAAVASNYGAATDEFKKVTPIIVSKPNGISKDALNYLKSNSYANDAEVVALGGEKAIPASDIEKIEKVMNATNAVERIAGTNRVDTNNKIISKYYTSTKLADSKGVVSVKDGIRNSSELVDALSAANFAAVKKAPIVLATDKVTDSQKNTLLNVDYDTKEVVIQVGQGASKTVLETLAKLLGVSNI